MAFAICYNYTSIWRVQYMTSKTPYFKKAWKAIKSPSTGSVYRQTNILQTCEIKVCLASFCLQDVSFSHVDNITTAINREIIIWMKFFFFSLELFSRLTHIGLINTLLKKKKIDRKHTEHFYILHVPVQFFYFNTGNKPSSGVKYQLNEPKNTITSLT